MIKKVKRFIKKILKYDSLNKYSIYERKNKYPKALKDLVKFYPQLMQEKLIMSSKYKTKKCNGQIEKIIKGYDFVNFDINNKSNNVKNLYSSECLSSGDAIKYKPFQPCINRLSCLVLSSALNCYPSTVGSSVAKNDLIEYLVKEGFNKNKTKYHDGIGLHNVAFSISTTQAFNSILRCIARPNDVILMSAPNYGIFAEIAEKQGVHVELIELLEEDKFLINPKKLNDKIVSINNNLKHECRNDKKCEYIPKCVAYLNINPHNPIGNVMTKDDLPLITEIADVCLEQGLFIIDDLIYRDLTFDQNKLAFPIASIPKYFNNTISLFGVSKSYGLAGFRAGFVVMPTPIYWGYASEVFDLMDSMPLLQVEIVRGAFNGKDDRYKKNKILF